MRPVYYVMLAFFVCIFTQNNQAQTQRQSQRSTSALRPDSLSSLSVRAEMKNREQTQNTNNAVWLREIYRNVDLNTESNAALCYPSEPIGDRMNLFTLVFRLMSQGKINGYKYLDGREIFTDQYKLNFEEILKDYDILYTTQGTGARTQYIINDVDIPSNEVMAYMIKEAWYFDQATGRFNSKVLAICPMLVRQEDDFGEPTRTPMFWLTYENLRPYLSRAYIMTSDVNNALTYTIDDFFSKRMYDGEIIKTTNMMNKSLAQQVGNDPEVIKHAQDSIENQLKFFEKQLSVPEDTTSTAKKGKEQKEKKTKESKPKESKPDKSSSAPTKSVRRTR